MAAKLDPPVLAVLERSLKASCSEPAAAESFFLALTTSKRDLSQVEPMSFVRAVLWKWADRNLGTVARKQWGVDAPSIIEVGARVQSYHYLEDRDPESPVVDVPIGVKNG
eukprot:Skav211340  [mRNA]  locus=scaffold3120:371775:373724:+ [translate_table: standard]